MKGPAAVVSRIVTALLAVVLAGCASSSMPQRQPEALDDGVQATGRLDGQRVAISDGAPETNVTDCDPATPDDDICWIARTIDGVTVTFVVENPGALVPGEEIAVETSTCQACDDVTDQAVVDLRIDGEPRRATSGRLRVREAGDRYAAAFDLRFPNADRLTGEFNIRELRPDEL